MSMIVCDVCPRACRLEEGQVGFCNVRVNINGENRNAIHGQVFDWCGYEPRGPLQMYYVYLTGCNLKCFFCCLPPLSRPSPQTTTLKELSAKESVEQAIDLNLPTFWFRGGEPTLHYEYVIEVARICQENGIVTLLSTNAYLDPCLLSKIGGLVTVPIVGIKGSASPMLYTKMNADPRAVLDGTEALWKTNDKTCIGLTVGPGLYAAREDHERLAKWICRKLSPDIQITVGTLASPGRRPSDISPLVDGAKNAHEEICRVASIFVENGLTNVWVEIPSMSDPSYIIGVTRFKLAEMTISFNQQIRKSYGLLGHSWPCPHGEKRMGKC